MWLGNLSNLRLLSHLEQQGMRCHSTKRRKISIATRPKSWHSECCSPLWHWFRVWVCVSKKRGIYEGSHEVLLSRPPPLLFDIVAHLREYKTYIYSWTKNQDDARIWHCQIFKAIYSMSFYQHVCRCVHNWVSDWLLFGLLNWPGPKHAHPVSPLLFSSPSFLSLPRLWLSIFF